MEILLDKSKNFFKANLHTHSTYSDGRLTVEEIKRIYKDKGYSVIAFTDHDIMVDNSHLNDENFLTITSCEVGVREEYVEKRPVNWTMKNMHFNLFALKADNVVNFYELVKKELPDIHKKFPPHIQEDGKFEKVHCDFNTEDINKIIKLANEKGFLVSLNHPTWNQQTPEEYLGLDNLFSIEIFNTGCTLLKGMPDDENVYEQLLKSGKKVFLHAADDSHNIEEIDSPYSDAFGGWVKINADELSYEKIMTALKNGDYFASTGPDIFSLTKDGDKVFVETSDCEKIYLLTKTRRGKAVIAKKGETVNKAEFELMPTDGYFRIKAVDKFGKVAYSQAYYL